MSLFADIGFQLKSKVWQHFTYNKAEQKAKCSVCSAIIKASGSSTKNLITHLKSKHQILFKSSIEKSVTVTKKRKIDLYFNNNRCESLGDVAKLAAVDGLTFNQIASSKLLRAFAADGYRLPSSQDYVKNVFIKQFAEIQTEIVTKILEIKETNNDFSISSDISTTIRNRRFIYLNLHFSVGFQSLGLIRVKGSLRNERAIELVQERLLPLSRMVHLL